MRSTALKHGIHASLIAATLVAGALTSERSAHALQGGEDPALLPVLIDKRFAAGGRHNLSLQVSTAMATKFIEGTGVYGAYQYSFSELFGLEVGGAFILGSESSIMAEVRQNFPGTEPPLSDLYQLQWMGNVDFVFVPVYGKMSFASEFDPSFDVFLLAGGGVAGTRRQFGFDDTKTFESAIAPVFNVGLGFRFYFTDLLALRLEFRDFFYPDPGAGENDVSGLTFNLHFQGGVQFTFGGAE